MVGTIPLQLLPDTTPLVRDAIAKARTFEVEGLEVKVVGPEHLLAMALKQEDAKIYSGPCTCTSGLPLIEVICKRAGRVRPGGKWKRTLATS